LKRWPRAGPASTVRENLGPAGAEVVGEEPEDWKVGRCTGARTAPEGLLAWAPPRAGTGVGPWLFFSPGGPPASVAGASVADPHDMHRTAATTLRKSQEGQTTPRVLVSKATMRRRYSRTSRAFPQ
jgi:hypothetical protein